MPWARESVAVAVGLLRGLLRLGGIFSGGEGGLDDGAFLLEDGERRLVFGELGGEGGDGGHVAISCWG